MEYGKKTENLQHKTIAVRQPEFRNIVQIVPFQQKLKIPQSGVVVVINHVFSPCRSVILSSNPANSELFDFFVYCLHLPEKIRILAGADAPHSGPVAGRDGLVSGCAVLPGYAALIPSAQPPSEHSPRRTADPPA